MVRRCIPVLLLLAACGGRPAAPPTAHRVVSLLPSFTEILFAIGAGDRVVGRSRFDVDPPEALAVPSVGDGLNPNVEAIAARSPDLVVLYQSAANAAAIDQLERLGVAVLALRGDQLDDVPRIARLLGERTGTLARADSLASAFERALDSARTSRPPAFRLSALILAWDQPPIVIGAGSFQSELVELAGLANAFGDIAAPSSQVTLETIVARDPDVVIHSGERPTPAWARRPEWRAVPAVRAGRFLRFDGTAFQHPSFRSLEAARALAARARSLD